MIRKPLQSNGQDQCSDVVVVGSVMTMVMVSVEQ
jgi:hypothetical protein